MNIQELAKTLNRSEKSIRTNYPDFVVSMAKKGIFIQRDSKFFDKANFIITKGQPKILKKEDISIRKYETNLIQNQKWIPSFLSQQLEISNQGRYRWIKEPNNFYRGTNAGEGYLKLVFQNKSYPVHRVVLQSFKPIQNFQYFTVDHLNGIRTDNRLQNLEWVTNEENTFRMLCNRKELNKELTRLIQKYSYQGVLDKLKAL